jgi:IPT/TIG domain
MQIKVQASAGPGASRSSVAAAEPTSTRSATSATAASAPPAYERGDRPTVIALGEARPAVAPEPDPSAYSRTYAPPAAGTSGAPDSPLSQPADPDARTPASGTTMKPAISGVSPASGPAKGGNEVLITGSDFASAQVLFGGQLAQVTSQSSNAVTVVVPEGESGPVAVVVTNREGTYSVAGSAYTYR